MAKNIVDVVNIKKIYNEGEETEVRALDGITLQIKKGEMVVIMGPSGSGKTTLLNCISGIDSVNSGKIIVDGNDIQGMKDREKTKYRASKMGFIFQSYNLIPVLNAVENVELPLLINGVKGKEARNKAKSFLKLVGLGDRMYHFPNKLSGGQNQRVTISRAMVHNPAIIWADEPTGNLDTKTANGIMKLIEKLNKEKNVTFVIVTHDLAIAKRAHRVINIEDGKVKEGS